MPILQQTEPIIDLNRPISSVLLSQINKHFDSSGLKQFFQTMLKAKPNEMQFFYNLVQLSLT